MRDGECSLVVRVAFTLRDVSIFQVATLLRDSVEGDVDVNATNWLV